MTTHSVLPPSSRHRWGACPGSVREEAKYPEQPSGPAAIDGTHSHTLLERCLKMEQDAKHFIGLQLEDHDGSFVVDDERAARVQVALDYIESRGGIVTAERKVDPAPLVGRRDLAGTVDVRIVFPDTMDIEIIDYKDGIGVVDAEGNPQLEQYALGVLAELEGVAKVNKVTMTIIQPRNTVRGLPTISSHTVDAAYILNDVRKTIIEQARATDDVNPPLVPGDKQCRWCKAKGSCAALSNSVMKEVGVMFTPIASPALDVAQQSANKDPAAMSGEQLQQILEAAPLLRQMIEAVEAEAQRRLEAGQVVPGFKLVNGRGSWVWSLAEDEIADKLIKMGVPKTAVYETKLVSPAKAEKLTWEKRDGTKVSLSPRQLRTLETEYVTKMAGKPTLAPESDSRPAVTMNAAPMFDAVPAAPAAPSLPSWLS